MVTEAVQRNNVQSRLLVHIRKMLKYTTNNIFREFRTKTNLCNSTVMHRFLPQVKHGYWKKKYRSSILNNTIEC